MNKFKDFYEIERYFLNLAMPLAGVQEEMPPEMFAPIANAFLNEFKCSLELYEIEHRFKQEKKEAKFRAKLERKNWRKRIKDDFCCKTVPAIVKEKAGSEQSERINSEAVYAPFLDNQPARKELPGQTETDKAAVCLIAGSSEAGPECGDEMAQPVATVVEPG